MRMNEPRDRQALTTVAVCTMMHLLVDGLCLCCLYLVAAQGQLSMRQLTGVFVAYNVLAFLTQPLTGHIADRLQHRHWLLLTSVMLLSAATALPPMMAMPSMPLPPVAAAMTVASLLGIGNSLFHVWGGIQVAHTTGNDIHALGMFVSTGAMGLAIGAVFCCWVLLYMLLAALVLLSIAWLHSGVTEKRRDDGNRAAAPRMLIAVVCMVALMAIVMGRSFAGEGFTSGIERTDGMVLLIGATAMAGKMAGGWLTHLTGMVMAVVIIVVAVVACALTKGTGITMMFAGLFAVNCSMPITLYLANVVLRGREGLAFGLLAAALMPGYLLAMLN